MVPHRPPRALPRGPTRARQQQTSATRAGRARVCQFCWPPQLSPTCDKHGSTEGATPVPRPS